MTVVYADSVFLLNMAMDYVLFLGTARLAGLPLRRGRYALAALLGGLYALAVFLPGLEAISVSPVKIGVGVLLSLVAFGGEEKLLRLILLLFGLACAMAGGVLGLSLLAGSPAPSVGGVFFTDVNGGVLLAAATAAYLLLSVVFRAAAAKGTEGRLIPVLVRIGGRTAELTALWDSGNTLRDGACGQPVLVTAPGTLDRVLPPLVRGLLKNGGLNMPETLLEPLRMAAPELRPRLIPYHAVGVAGGLLLTITTEQVEVNGTQYAGLAAALSPTPLGDGYSALWGGEIKKGGRHGSKKRMEAAAGAAGDPAGGRRALHRRQRYASAAVDEGAGSRTSGSYSG